MGIDGDLHRDVYTRFSIARSEYANGSARGYFSCRMQRGTVAWSVLLVASLALVADVAVASDAPCTSGASCRRELELRTGKHLGYYSTFALAPSARVTRVVIVIHGRGRDAQAYFSAGVAAASAERRLADVLVLAPQLASRSRRDEHHWRSSDWIGGGRSDDAAQVSSFAVLDELLASLCGAGASTFPRLDTVVLAGHSAGAQLVHRYVAGGVGCRDSRVTMRYVVMNPSSYLYIDGRRRAGTGRFDVPETDCARYDEYKYGLRDLNAYLERVGPARMRARLLTRRTWYLTGAEDTAHDDGLDESCAARLQGSERLSRARSYARYTRLFPAWTGSVFLTVPGIGHDGRQMLLSESARRIMFR